MAKRKPQLNAQILEEATAWFIDFTEEEVDEAGEENFGAWLRQSPEHVRAFLQVSAFWEEAETLSKRPNPDIAGLIARAKAEHNVFPLEVAPREAAELPLERTPVILTKDGIQRRIPLAIAATMLVAIGTSLTAWYTSYSAPTYATEIGEQRSITLEDGSSVELNSRSRIKLRFTASERGVELVEGQALFKVEKDRARPFVVTTGDTKVRAVGTEFDVYRKRTGTVVTVVEGRVAVVPNPEFGRTIPSSSESSQKIARSTGNNSGFSTHAPALLLSAGEQTVITSTAIEAPRPANIAVAMAWTDNKLVFESTPLREVVDEFNRYNRQQLVIRDPELYDFHISGVFPSTDSNRMVAFLRQRFGVTLSRSGDEIEISRKSGV